MTETTLEQRRAVFYRRRRGWVCLTFGLLAIAFGWAMSSAEGAAVAVAAVLLLGGFATVIAGLFLLQRPAP